MASASIMTATCACGSVEIKGFGKPIVSAICYCADCQKGAREIEALPGAAPVLDRDGGSAYILFRKDRFTYAKGAELLKPYKIKETSPTNRVVASCCNSAMFVNFDKGPFWVSAYRARFAGALPPLEMRMCTKSAPADVMLPNDLPNSKGLPLRLAGRLLASGAAMLLRM